MLTALDTKRLLDLTAKGVAYLTPAEQAELQQLQTRAASTDDRALSEEDVKRLVTDSVKSALQGHSHLAETQVKAIVDSAVAGIRPNLTADDVKSVVETALKGLRRDSKMQHPCDSEPSIELPIAHRSGNLSVAMKQLLNVMTGKSVDADIPESLLYEAERRGQRSEKTMFARLRTKAGFTTSAAGAGAEWMNESLSSVLLQRMYLESQLAAALARTEVQMPTNPFNYPLSTTRPQFFLTGEGEDPTESQGGTDDLTLNAKKLTGIVPYTYEADEDSIVAILPQTVQQLAEAAAEALEDAILNGDSATTHQDSDINAVAKHSARIFNGVRKLTLAQSELKVSLATGGITTANIGELRKRLGRWGLNPKNLLLVAGVAGYNDLTLLPETLTAEKVGNAATARILTGIAPNLLGMDIVASARMREDLNARCHPLRR